MTKEEIKELSNLVKEIEILDGIQKHLENQRVVKLRLAIYPNYNDRFPNKNLIVLSPEISRMLWNKLIDFKESHEAMIEDLELVCNEKEPEGEDKESEEDRKDPRPEGPPELNEEGEDNL